MFIAVFIKGHLSFASDDLARGGGDIVRGHAVVDEQLFHPAAVHPAITHPNSFEGYRAFFCEHLSQPRIQIHP